MRRRVGTLSAAAAIAAAASFFAGPSAAHAANLSTFRVGVQLADAGGASQFGTEQFTRNVKFGNSSSPWAGDANGVDPDAVLIDLNTTPGDPLNHLDFRIGAQAMDGSGHYGPVQYTPWASEGGGTSGMVTDDNGYDPDKYRIFLDTRSWPSEATLVDFRLSVAAEDNSRVGQPAYTPWASQGGGRSTLAVDDNSYDFDGIVLGLEVQ
ncbi:hypothetical protein ACZ90_18195 [Streptomyces albus subsp. albus]|nr:hypothetical protein ACZ90_18195 [Streptomyces albus subsp. albus]